MHIIRLQDILLEYIHMLHHVQILNNRFSARVRPKHEEAETWPTKLDKHNTPEICSAQIGYARLSLAFSELRRTVLCAQLSRTHSNSLIVCASF